MREVKGQLLTDKSEKNRHGFGLMNVREIVEKYDGMMDVSYTKDVFRVVILIRDV